MFRDEREDILLSMEKRSNEMKQKYREREKKKLMNPYTSAALKFKILQNEQRTMDGDDDDNNKLNGTKNPDEMVRYE